MADLPNQGDPTPWGTRFRAWLLTSFNLDGTLNRAAIQASLGTSLLGVLLWDTATNDYLPTDLKASAAPKEFRGPVDPQTVAGVVLHVRDSWDATV